MGGGRGLRDSFHHFPEPLESEFDTEEEYNEAHDLWESAESAWEDEYHEMMMAQRYGD